MAIHAKTRVRQRSLQRATAVVAAVAILTSCQTLEEYVPTLVLAGGAIGTVLALNYYQEQPDYALAATGLIGTLTSLGLGAADSYVQHRRRQREIEELQRIEEAVESEYAELERQQSDGANEWGSAGPGPGDGWEATAPQPVRPPAPAPTPAPAPGGGSDAPWGDRYPTPGEGSASSAMIPRDPDAPPLALDVALLQRVGPDGDQVASLGDGAVLHDGIGDEEPGDELRVFFRTSEDAYVYVIAVDSIGRVQPLFPSSFPDRMNPVPAQEPVLLPSGSDWYGLDQYAGLQHVYFHAGPQRQPDLEAQMAALVELPPAPRGDVYAVTERTILETPAVQARGLTGVRPEVEAQIGMSGSGPGQSIRTTRYEALAPGEGVSATRIFEHR